MDHKDHQALPQGTHKGLRIVKKTPVDLEEYQRIRSILIVRSTYRIEPVGRGFQLREEQVTVPWLKDYDALENDRPVNLVKTYDLNRWGIFLAYIGNCAVGGAIVAPPPDAWFTWRGASLVDIRVASSVHRRGIGSALVEACAIWARERGLPELVIETQNVNVPACRFYEAQGCTISAVNKGAYVHYPDEIGIIWKLAL